MKKYTLECVNFLAGALGMIIELVAARILSPYLGNSQMIWTCIIGMMLAFMSAGYYIGGKIADKKPSKNIVSLLLINAALFISLIPLIEIAIIKPFSELEAKINPIIIAIICSSITFGPASLFLATVSPFAVKLKELETNQTNDIGKISGKMSAISTIGSIVGTFTAGFILIPNLGVKKIILISTITVALLSFIIHEEKNIKYILKSIIIIAIFIVIILYGKSLFSKANPDIILDTDSEYSRIWVRKINENNKSYYTLEADKGYESIASDNGSLYSDYMKYYDLFNYYNPNTKNVLMIGGAAYVYPTYFLKNFENKNIDVVEIDSKMTKIAKEYFNLDTKNERLNIYHQDGRAYLNKAKNTYDCILIDAFKGINAPFHLATYEAVLNSKKALNDNGIIITNIVSSLKGKDSDFIKYEYATYKAVFDEVKLFCVQKNIFEEDELQNLILVGFKNKNITSNNNLEIYNTLLENEVLDFKTDKKPVTDDFCPIGV